ncbi:gluconate transporter [Marivirga lumbricoides]|uniref:Gluconate transporter n=1 Tax=Marivirga lumbricoides TaxID=1046115 RepID=A0A2T4DPB8_9BACT|nr:gluconate transporter [Marivirga lumbricoides]
MIQYNLLTAVVAGIFILLSLILRLKLHAFISLLIASIAVGVIAGLEPMFIMKTIQEGMANTLGFVATVVGLGAMFGAILEQSGGARVIATFLIEKMGEKKAPVAMALAGFIIAIPVFFEVAFILLVPMIYALQRKTKKSLLLYALPLLAGLAITHAFIPPTPGPIAVADIIGADLGWVILIGCVTGFPAVIIGGLYYGKYIGNRIYVEAPTHDLLKKKEGLQNKKKVPAVSTILFIIAIPILLILTSTFADSGIVEIQSGILLEVISLIGHPFSALIIANIIAWNILGLKLGYTKAELLKVTSKSMEPAGLIILITGAGGVFKQMLVNTGAGELIAESLGGIGFPIIVFAFIVALIVRVIQGSATVAMITAASLVAPLISNTSTSFEIACVVVAIAAGGTFLSHVNDSGYWLVKEFLGISEKVTFKTWTVMTAIISVTAFCIVCLITYIF